MFQNAECQCRKGEEFMAVGLAARLCQHSSATEVEEVREQLDRVMAEFTDKVDPTKFFEMPLNDAFDYFCRSLVEEEHFDQFMKAEGMYEAMYAGFLRHYGVTLLYLFTMFLASVPEGKFVLPEESATQEEPPQRRRGLFGFGRGNR